jgi:hypothetical protein
MKPDAAASKTNPLISLSNEEAVKQIVSGTVFGLWNIVNDLSRLRPPIARTIALLFLVQRALNQAPLPMKKSNASQPHFQRWDMTSSPVAVQV